MKQQENIRIYFTHTIIAKASNNVDINNFTIFIVRLSYVIFINDVCKLL